MQKFLCECFAITLHAMQNVLNILCGQNNLFVLRGGKS